MLDEPTANLDPAARRDLIEVVRRPAVTTLVVTHDLPLALELCPRSVVLDAAASPPTAPPQASSPTATYAAHRLELPYAMVVAPAVHRASRHAHLSVPDRAEDRP